MALRHDRQGAGQQERGADALDDASGDEQRRAGGETGAAFGVIAQAIKEFCMARVDGLECCIAVGLSPGYETYATGWRSVIIQPVG